MFYKQYGPEQQLLLSVCGVNWRLYLPKT